MLMNCPKCGFSQPKDRYCASCGVDIDHYRPTPSPILKQILLNPAFLIAVTLAIVLGSVIFIRNKQNEELAARAQLLRSGPVIVDQSREAAKTESAPIAIQHFKAQSDQASEGVALPRDTSLPTDSPPPTAPLDATPDVAKKDPASNKTAEETKAAPVKDRKIKLIASYAEVDKQVLAHLIEESQPLGQFTDFGDFKSGPLPSTLSKMESTRGVKVLQNVTKEFDAKSLQQQWFVGHKGEEEVGLTTLVALEQMGADGHVRGEIEVLRSFYEGQEEVVKKSYPISGFDLSPGWGWMMSLNLPRAFDQSPGEEMAPQGFLRLFRWDSFKKGESEFTLFLEFDTRTP